MADPWPLLNWPWRFPLLHQPVIVRGAGAPETISLRRVSKNFGITPNAMGRFRHRHFGPRHRWRWGRFVVLARDLDAWLARPRRSGELKMLAELQHTDPADFLKAQARASLEQIGRDQRRARG